MSCVDGEATSEMATTSQLSITELGDKALLEDICFHIRHLYDLKAELVKRSNWLNVEAACCHLAQARAILLRRGRNEV